MADQFRYTAADIAEVTDGRVALKTINNWANADDWFSPLAQTETGRARKFSRLNVIEAALASYLMLGGVSRREAKMLIKLMAAKGTSDGWDADLPKRLERRAPFKRGSSGWFWVLTLSSVGRAGLDGICEVQRDGLAETLADGEHAAIVVPVSSIVGKIDAIQTEAG